MRLGIGGPGPELTPETPGKSHDSETRGNKSGNIPADQTDTTTPEDARLAAVARAWPELPEAVRAGIMAMVSASQG